MINNTLWFKTEISDVKEGYGKGTQIQLAVSLDGVPSDPFWRKRFNEKAISKLKEQPKRKASKKLSIETKKGGE